MQPKDHRTNTCRPNSSLPLVGVSPCQGNVGQLPAGRRDTVTPQIGANQPHTWGREHTARGPPAGPAQPARPCLPLGPSSSRIAHETNSDAAASDRLGADVGIGHAQELLEDAHGLAFSLSHVGGIPSDSARSRASSKTVRSGTTASTSRVRRSSYTVTAIAAPPTTYSRGHSTRSTYLDSSREGLPRWLETGHPRQG